MTELKNEHFEVISKNKQKALNDQKKMRIEIKQFVDNCNVYELSIIYDECKRLKKNR
tara:strand:+ start:573 stop:743 length:171 start_codon:yes stop_codon:yes gene_type:complete